MSRSGAQGYGPENAFTISKWIPGFRASVCKRHFLPIISEQHFEERKHFLVLKASRCQIVGAFSQIKQAANCRVAVWKCNDYPTLVAYIEIKEILIYFPL